MVGGGSQFDGYTCLILDLISCLILHVDLAVIHDKIETRTDMVLSIDNK